MRFLLRPYRMIATLLVICYLTMGFAPCSRANLVTSAHEVVSALDEAIPIFETNGLGTARLREARSIASKLEVAFQNAQTNEAAALVSSLIPVFQQIVAETQRISNPTTKTIILVALAVGNIALRRIADNLAEVVPATPSRGADNAARVIGEFRQKKKWNCRSSVTGRFEEMGFCKKFPATSTVETF